MWRVLLAALLAQPAAAECRLALAMGLDVSGSVDAGEARLQREGLARALLAPNVARAILSSAPGAPVDLFVYEWSGPASQVVLVGWTTILGPDDLGRVANIVGSQISRPSGPETALGVAMLFGGQALAQRGECWRRVLDLSGDGPSNIGPRPRETRRDPVMGGVTVNGLAVGKPPDQMAGMRADSVPELSAYFRAEVIRGPDAFVEVALGYEDYRAAMERKLLRELEDRPTAEAEGLVREARNGP